MIYDGSNELKASKWDIRLLQWQCVTLRLVAYKQHRLLAEKQYVITVNFLALGRLELLFSKVIFKLVLEAYGWGIYYEIALRCHWTLLMICQHWFSKVLVLSLGLNDHNGVPN